MSRLLIAGGSRDANLGWLGDAARRLGVECELVLVSPQSLPDFVWRLGDGPPTISGRPVEASAAFLRYDVFEPIANPTPGAAQSAQAWFATFMGWCQVARLFTFNRTIDAVSASKPAMLVRAREAGLDVPPTLITNVGPAVADEGGPRIAKPVGGGSYVLELGEAIGSARWVDRRSPSPAIVQPMQAYPERRIYRIGDAFFAFDIRSSTVDSRRDGKGAILPYPIEALPDGVLPALRRLTDDIRCDFCAVDMKTDPASGRLVFLELNNGPMFIGYDRSAGGTMAEAMVRYLMRGGS